MKICTRCGEMKTLEEYYNDVRKKDGHAGQCKKCRNKTGEKWRNEHKERQRMLCKQWYEKNIEGNEK